MPEKNGKRLEGRNRETFKAICGNPLTALRSALLPFLSANWAQPRWSWEVTGYTARLSVIGLGSVYTASGTDLRGFDGEAWQEGEV